MDKVFEEIIKALKPLVDIADAYDANALELDEDIETNEYTFVSAVDGISLLTLKDCFLARAVTRELQKRFIP